MLLYLLHLYILPIHRICFMKLNGDEKYSTLPVQTCRRIVVAFPHLNPPPQRHQRTWRAFPSYGANTCTVWYQRCLRFLAWFVALFSYLLPSRKWKSNSSSYFKSRHMYKLSYLETERSQSHMESHYWICIINCMSSDLPLVTIQCSQHVSTI